MCNLAFKCTLALMKQPLGFQKMIFRFHWMGTFHAQARTPNKFAAQRKLSWPRFAQLFSNVNGFCEARLWVEGEAETKVSLLQKRQALTGSGPFDRDPVIFRSQSKITFV